MAQAASASWTASETGLRLKMGLLGQVVATYVVAGNINHLSITHFECKTINYYIRLIVV
jgi:hypothetical protein